MTKTSCSHTVKAYIAKLSTKQITNIWWNGQNRLCSFFKLKVIFSPFPSMTLIMMDKSERLYFGRELLFDVWVALSGWLRIQKIPRRRKTQFPLFALPSTNTPAGEIWHFSLHQNATKIQFFFKVYAKIRAKLDCGYKMITSWQPHCRKIQNGRQIMFQCDRGYSMIEGPSGATCIAGCCYIHTKISLRWWLWWWHPCSGNPW